MRPENAAIAFLLGDESADTLAAMRAAMLAFYMQAVDRPLPMHVMLRSGSPRIGRAELRRHHLRRALAMLPGPTSWARRKQLAEACRFFENRRWPAWNRLDAPPDHASEIDRVLWDARQFGELPMTPENFAGLQSES